MPLRFPTKSFFPPSTRDFGSPAWHQQVTAAYARNLHEAEQYSTALPFGDISGLTSRQILFGSPAGRIAQSASLFYDSTVNLLTVGGLSGTSATLTGPLQSSNTTVNNLQVNGSATFAGGITFSTGAASFGDVTVSHLHVSSGLQVDGASSFYGPAAFLSTAIGFFSLVPSTQPTSYTLSPLTTGRVFPSTVTTATQSTVDVKALQNAFNQLLGVVAALAEDLGVGGAGFGLLR